MMHVGLCTRDNKQYNNNEKKNKNKNNRSTAIIMTNTKSENYDYAYNTVIIVICHQKISQAKTTSCLISKNLCVMAEAKQDYLLCLKKERILVFVV